MYVCIKSMYKGVHISIISNSAKEGNSEMYSHSTISTEIVAGFYNEVLRSGENEYSHRWH